MENSVVTYSSTYQGKDGKSAYQIACDNGFVGSQKLWIDSLKGESGTSEISDKEYNPSENSGLGRKTLKLNNNSNILTQLDFNKTNTIYVISYDFNLNGKTIEIPQECILDFKGGSLNNGTISGNNTSVISPIVLIFGNNLILVGSFICKEAYPEWFGAKGDGDTNDTEAIKKVLNYFRGHTILFSGGKVYTGDSCIPVYSNTEIVIDGTIISTNKLQVNNGISFEFYDRITSTPGYTGVHDVIIRGHGTIDPLGSTVKGQATPLRIHHCKNITIKDITCKGHYYWHFIECGGTDGLLVDNVTFYSGYNDSNQSYDTIQLETIDSSSTEGAIPYDSTVTKNVIIRNCKYIVQDESPTISTFIGGHYVDAISNINILNCICYGNKNRPESRCIEFPGSANNIHISGCKFINFINREPIRFGYGNLDKSLYVHDVNIENCIFENSPIASIIEVNHIILKNNTIVQNEQLDFNHAIFIRNSSDINICDNIFSNIKYYTCLRLDYDNCSDIIVHGNIAKYIDYHFLRTCQNQSCNISNFVISNNYIEDYGLKGSSQYPAPAIYLQSGNIDKTIISNNTFIISSDLQYLPIHCPMTNINNVSIIINDNDVIIKGTLTQDAKNNMEENISRFNRDISIFKIGM